MVSLPSLGGSSAPPSVRQPAFSVQFGAGGSGGALGGLAAAGAALGLGGGQGDPWQETVVAIHISLGLAPAVNAAEIYLAAGERAPAVAVGDTGSIGLGYGDAAAQTVFSGQVEAVRHDVRGFTRLTVTDGGATLSRLRVNQSYEQQAAGDIVSDLAGQAGVDTDRIESGSRFPFYAVDDGRHAFAQIAGLARKCGLLAYFTAEGKLCLAAASGGQPAQTFTYGQDVLALAASEATPTSGKATAIGEGAAGSQGQAAWGWLLKDPSAVTASAGSGTPESRVVDAGLRTADAAQAAAASLAALASQMQLAGSLLVPGAPAVVVAGTIAVAGAPQDILNGTFLVRSVEHHFAKAQGFTTRIAFCQAGGPGGSGGGLLGGLGL